MTAHRTRSSPALSTDRRRSTCSRCRRGIYAGQDTQWSHDPTGLVHVVCPDLASVVLPSEQGGPDEHRTVCH